MTRIRRETRFCTWRLGSEVVDESLEDGVVFEPVLLRFHPEGVFFYVSRVDLKQDEVTSVTSNRTHVGSLPRK